MKRNRYAKKRKHKRELEKRFAKRYAYDNVFLLRDKLITEAEEDTWWRRKHPPKNNGWEYWKYFSLSGRRAYAKKYTDKTIRQKYRQMIKHCDPEDVTAPRGADYEKEFDYAYTIW